MLWYFGQVLLTQLAPESKGSIQTIQLEGVKIDAALENLKLLLNWTREIPGVFAKPCRGCR